MPLEDVYKTEARFLQHLQTQAANVNQYKTELGATTQEIDDVTNDAANFEFLIETCNIADEFKLTGFAIKKQFFGNKTTPPVGDFSTPPSTTPPHTPITAGAVKTSRDRDQRWLHNGLSEGCKNAMDLIGPESGAPDLATLQPTFEGHPGSMNYEVGIVVANRADSDMWELWVRPKGGDWTLLGSATGKTGNFNYSGNGDPIVLDMRIQLKKNNENYGQPSDIKSRTLNP